jgi:hypothetical protein
VGSGWTIPVVREALVELQVGSGRTIPIVRGALVELTLGQRALKIWVFVTDITDEFILGLDILGAYHATVDMGRHVVRLCQDELPVRITYSFGVNVVEAYREP